MNILNLRKAHTTPELFLESSSTISSLDVSADTPHSDNSTTKLLKKSSGRCAILRKSSMLILFFGTLVCLSLFVGVNTTVLAADDATYQPYKEACNDATSGSAVCQSEKGNPINDTIINVTNLVALVTGILAVVIIIFAGFKFIISGGNPENIKKAREMLIYAVVGLIVIVFARTIIVFVAQKLLN